MRSEKISIVTVTYNSAATIADTLESVRTQSYGPIEHIIVDGGSSDDTLRIARSFPHIAKIISEKDNGIYDAMNKGLGLATGDIIGILNSDDVYSHKDVLKNVAHAFAHNHTDTLYGNLQYTDAKNFNKVLRDWNSGLFKKSLFKFGWMPPHPTFFVKRQVYQQVGGFNLNLKMSADYELMLRILFKYGFTTSYLPEVLVKMRTGGASNASLKNRLKANKEDRLAWKLNELRPYFFTLYLKPLRKIFQYMNLEQLRRLPGLHTAH
ncbi:glycosyltransferase family 2 protein [Paraflavisolibacter sp. H34]|uniref:glycosyltransferase family 2 protein n=1 Tax=Huijunlia imazamoxiresistens TaxID=3127457 RepID=UPI003015AD70